MKTQVALSVLAGLVFSASALADTPASYDTKINVSANVPDSAHITDASGKPITDLDVVLKPASSGFMEATTPVLKLWNNDVEGRDVSLIIDDSQAANGGSFILYSRQGGVLNSMTYRIDTMTTAGTTRYTTSGQSEDFALVANGTHSELPITFNFISDARYADLGQGNYTGVIYANVNARA